MIDAVKSKGFLMDYEVELKRKDGTPFHAQLSVNSINFGGNQAIMASVLDITERKRAEEALRKRQEELQAVLDLAPVAIWMAHDAQCLQITGNHYAEEFIMRVPRSSNISASAQPGDAAVTYKALRNGVELKPEELPAQAAAATGQLVAPETLELVFPNGRVTYVMMGAAPLFDAEGRVRGSVAAGVDVTMLKQTGDALRASEARLRLALDAARAGSWEWDVLTNRAVWSEELWKLYGLEPHSCEPSYEAWLQTVHPDDRARIAQGVQESARVGAELMVEWRVRGRDGAEHWLMSRGQPMRDAGGRVVRYIGVAVDVTEHKWIETELQDARDRLEQKVAERTAELASRTEAFIQAQKMEAIGRLAGGVAHDFNNLLTVVTGFGRRVLRDEALDPSHRAAVDQMTRAGERAATLTRQLLAFSRKQVLQPESLDLNAAMRELCRILPASLGEDIELVCELREDCRPVFADRNQIEQTVMNLANNARDAMPDGGRLTLRTSNVTVGGPEGGNPPDVPAGDYVCLEVEDTGTGMSEEVRQHIFEPFFTTKDRGAGTGLGLASVYGMVEQSGGHIRVKTAPGQGTTFSLYFPKAAVEDQPRATADANGRLPRGRETILLVEDERSVCDLVASDLRDMGYTVLPCSTIGDALKAAEMHPGTIDLMLADVIMPGVSGPTLAQQLMARSKVPRVLYMSGHAEKHIAQHGVLRDGVELIGKPFTAEALARKIRGLLDGRTARH
jgi:PAS domain S-box-containing protein